MEDPQTYSLGLIKRDINIFMKASLILKKIFALSLLLPQFLFAQDAGVGQTADTVPTPKPATESEIIELLKAPLDLNACMRIALKKNILLGIAKQDLDAAAASLSGSYGTFMPVFSLSGIQVGSKETQFDSLTSSFNDFNNKEYTGSVTQKFITNGAFVATGTQTSEFNSPDEFGTPPTEKETFNYSVQFTQPLLKNGWFTMAKSPVTIAKYSYEIQQQILTASELATVFNLKSAFYEVILQREIIEANLAAISRDSALVQLSEAKFRASLATRRDVLSAEIQIADDQASLISSQAELQSALDRLKETMGIPIRFPIILVDVTLGYSNDPLEEEALINLALEKNPGIRGGEISVKRSTLEKRVAGNQRLPELDFYARYRHNNNKQIASFKRNEGNDTEFGLTLTYSFLEKETRAANQVAEIALSTQRANLANTRRQVILLVRDIARKTFANVQAIEVLKKNIDVANEKVRFANTMFNLGRASNLDITDAQQALLRSEIQYATKLVDYHLLIAELETIIGQQLIY